MDVDPPVPPYNTSDTTSFAAPSATDRWPIIVTGAIDDVHRSVNTKTDADVIAEGKQIVSQLAQLKYELQHDRPMTPIPDDGQSDIATYNAELARLTNPTWHAVPWLYTECYLYRRMHTIFALSTHWKGYDIFARQKMSTFRSSRPAVLELASRYRGLVSELEDSAAGADASEEAKEKKKALFMEMCEICLWGNATDLSLLTNLSYSDIQKLQGSEARKESEKNIIANDLPTAYELLSKLSRNQNVDGKAEEGQAGRVDIVLDNAGFELFVDLFLASYLLTSSLASTIVLHPKNIPWFVSDVTPPDFASLLSILADPRAFYSTPSEDESHSKTQEQPPPLSEAETSDLEFLFKHWSALYEQGKIIIRPHAFWTTAHPYWRLPTAAPDLHSDLQRSSLVIFKGDLNYRKLTADVMWEPTTPFVEAIGPLGKGSGVRTLALRTCKADVVVGLREGLDEELRKGQEGGSGKERKWAWSGKWAVVQYCDGKA